MTQHKTALGSAGNRQALEHARQQGPDSGQLIRFPQAKRGRGRPRKDRTPQPAQESFEMIAVSLTSLRACDAAWARAAERQRLAMIQKRLRPTTIAVVDYMTLRLNRSEGKGFDWRSAKSYAQVLGCEPRSVMRAFEEARSKGFLLRRQVGQFWHSTLPKMFALAAAAQAELDAWSLGSQGHERTRKSQRRTEKSIQRTGNSDGAPENTEGCARNSPTVRQKVIDGAPERQEGCARKYTKFLFRNLGKKNLSPPTPRAPRRGRESETVDSLIEEVRSEPGCGLVTERLLEPILRNRRFAAPDPVYALKRLADWAKDQPRDVLDDAARLVLDARYAEVFEDHITKAVKEAVRRTGQHAPIDRPSVTMARLTISRDQHPREFEAWMAHYRAKGLRTVVSLCEREGHCVEATMLPPTNTETPKDTP